LEREGFVQSASIVPAEGPFLKFSISPVRVSSKSPSEKIGLHPSLELLRAVHQHDRDSEPIRPLELLIAVNEDLLEVEIDLLEQGQDHLPGLIAQAAPPSGVHGEQGSGPGQAQPPEGAGVGRRRVALRNPQYITATPTASVTEKPAKLAAAAKAAPAATTVAPSTTRRVP
jgi:hypothetical protein